MFSPGNVSHLAVSCWVCCNGFIFQVKSLSQCLNFFISVFNFKFLNVFAILFYLRCTQKLNLISFESWNIPFSWIFPKLLLTAIQLKINLYSPVEEETNYGDFRRVVGKKRGVTLKVIPTSFQGVNLLSLIWYPTPGNPGGGRLCQIWSYYKYCC